MVSSAGKVPSYTYRLKVSENVFGDAILIEFGFYVFNHIIDDRPIHTRLQRVTTEEHKRRTQ